MNRMRVTIPEAGVDLLVDLNDTDTAAAIWAALPFASAAQTWSAEVYFTVPVVHDPEDAQATVSHGAVGYWPPGNALCLFFGQQPVSPVNLVGTVVGDASVLEAVADGQTVHVDRADADSTAP